MMLVPEFLRVAMATEAGSSCFGPKGREQAVTVQELEFVVPP